MSNELHAYSTSGLTLYAVLLTSPPTFHLHVDAGFSSFKIVVTLPNGGYTASTTQYVPGD